MNSALGLSKRHLVVAVSVAITAVILSISYVHAENQPWQIKKSKHFVVYFQEASPGYLNQLVRKAEYYYQSITDYLGFRRFDFWTWENRCKIYFYPSRSVYLDDTGNLSWTRAHVHVIKKEMSTYIGQERFFDTILPHELGHIIFREFVGYKTRLPLWLDEGVACMQEAESQKRSSLARALVKQGNYIPLAELSSMRDYNSIIPAVFYSQAASIVDFLLRRFGRERFVLLCRRLRDGQDWQEALKSIYRFEDLGELEKLWIANLKG